MPCQSLSLHPVSAHFRQQQWKELSCIIAILSQVESQAMQAMGAVSLAPHIFVHRNVFQQPGYRGRDVKLSGLRCAIFVRPLSPQPHWLRSGAIIMSCMYFSWSHVHSLSSVSMRLCLLRFLYVFRRRERLAREFAEPADPGLSSSMHFRFGGQSSVHPVTVPYMRRCSRYVTPTATIHLWTHYTF